MLSPNNYSITFACYNAVEYTKKCIASFAATGTPLDRVVIVDNCSTDGTRDYLQTLNLGGRIFNSANMGCGVAWNQGALALQSEWTIVMNNDVVVCGNWIENLIGTAKRLDLKVISPAMIEGDLDYDFKKFSTDACTRLSTVERRGDRNPVCLAIHRSVFMEAGYFRAETKLMGYEDILFFNALRFNKIQTSITGASWLHHFGSITQTLLKQERGMKQSDSLAARANSRLLNQSYFTRKLNKVRRNKQQKMWRDAEVAAHEMSLRGERVNGQFNWH